MSRKRSINFIYAVFAITLFSGVCTLFIVHTTRAVSEQIEENDREHQSILQSL